MKSKKTNIKNFGDLFGGRSGVFSGIYIIPMIIEYEGFVVMNDWNSFDSKTACGIFLTHLVLHLK